MNSRPFSLPRRRGAFTLVELLVAISIIVMLATLLVPAARQALDHAKDTKCASNLRQAGMLIQAAAMEDNGAYPQIENDVQNPIHTTEDGKVWTLPELMQARGGTVDILKCPADLQTKLAHAKSGATTSYFEAKGSSYEWYPYYEGENVNAVKRYGRFGVRVLPQSRVRLLMDYAESGEAPHSRSDAGSTMHVLYADGTVRNVVLAKEAN